MRYRKEKKSFTVLNIVTTIAEEAGILIVLLLILPWMGINVPVLVTVILAVAWAAWSYFSYWFGLKTFDKSPVMGSEALVGARCTTTTPLSPTGYVKVQNELWQAHSLEGEVNPEIEVMIVEVKGLVLLVTPSLDAAPGKTRTPDQIQL